MRRRSSMAPSSRRRHLRRMFDSRVEREQRRYSGEPRRLLLGTLRDRFLLRHVPRRAEVVLELGPGPGRFTPVLLEARPERLLAVDLSREGLRRARRRRRHRSGYSRIDWIQAAGEHLPLRPRSVDAVVALGNIVSFAGRDGPRLVRELGRVLRPQGVLIADFASPAASALDFFYAAAERRLLRRILRRPEYYLLDEILATGFQPCHRDPRRLATWEFQFYTAGEAERTVTHGGFRVTDLMAVAPLAAFQNRVARIARRDRRSWENLLRIEERVGRRPGVLETGHGFIIAARRA